MCEDPESFYGSYSLVAYRAVAWEGDVIVSSSYPQSDRPKAEAEVKSLLEEGHQDVELLSIWMSLSGKDLFTVEVTER